MSELTGLEIAIIGMSGRFPRSKNIEDFWENLINGIELISTFSNSAHKDIDSDEPNKTIKAGAILDDIELFDASFFGLNPREAETIDPQHRLFLECAWEALENAGYNSDIEERAIGVYAGVGMGTYLLYNLAPNQGLVESRGFLQTLVGVDKDYLPTRVSYKLNLKGPSVSVGTACSSSLVAVHLACQSLLSGECEMALATGVAVKVPQNEVTLSPGEVISPDGHCKAFDAKANGTIGGNGVGVVVLKRLEDAIADRDHIYAVIKGSAINNDGALKVGYTAPSEEGQAKVIRAAQLMAEVEPETITYVEAHGTGTTLGDPIEVAALKRAFRVSTDEKGYCAIGSVKTNVGHLDAAAGITGLIKTVLALDNKLLPPTINFETPNPQIDFENSPFYVNTKLSNWEANGSPRRAGVSSFGFGGTNAHVILEEAPVVDASSPSRSRQLLLISAKTHSALETATANLANHLKQHPDLDIADVAYTLQVGRWALNHRRMVLAEDIKDAIKALESEPQRVFTSFTESDDRSVVFMFTGQGAQYVNMARELYQSETIFRQECDRCCEFLQPYLKLDLRQLLFSTEEDTKKAAQQLQQTSITQPALFVIEYALAKLWMAWGVKPVAMIGHSIGEYVAACLADVFSLEDALALVAARGQLMQQLPSGSMLAVPLPAKEVEPLLGNDLSVAVINGPSACVVSGETVAVEALQSHLAASSIDSRLLHTSHAFHSPMMEPILETFQEQVKQVTLKPPQIPYISNVTGTWITVQEATSPSYWTSHLRQTVRFADGLQVLLKQSSQVLLEVGPDRTLSKLAKQHPEKTPEQIVLTSVRHPKENQSDVAFLLNTLGQLWLAGVQIDWSGFYSDEKRDRIPLPTYPFERQRYWIDPPNQAPEHKPSLKSSRPHLLEKKGTSQKFDITDWFYIPSWKRCLPLQPLQSLDQEMQPGCRLVFLDECGLGHKILKRLRGKGQDVVIVRIGEEFSHQIQLSDGSQRVYTINPQREQDYNDLIKDLVNLDLIPRTIVHLWSLTTQSYIESGLENIDRIQEQGFYSLLFLTQALGNQSVTSQLQIIALSNNLQSVTGEELLSPEKATLLGAVKVVPQEYPNIQCRSIDIVLPESSSQEKKLLDCLLAEFGADNSDNVIAYRGIHRWAPDFEPVRLDKSVNGISRLRQGGVYLITGGLGAIGLEFALYLAKTVQGKLILTGRSAFPTKSEWEKCLSNSDYDDEVRRKIGKLQELENYGAEVLVAQADVADLKAMQQVLSQAKEQFGQINGVFHAAGVLGDGAIALKTREDIETVLAPKLKGTLVLDTLLRDIDLDFILLCSSGASISPRPGQISYSSANNFLDAFAYYKTTQDGTFVSSVNLNNAWLEGGMAVKAAKKLAQSANISQPQSKAVTNPLFDQCLVDGADEIYISTLSINKYWFLDEHRLGENPIVPGTAYLELALAACGTHAQPGTTELQDVTFLAPLILEDSRQVIEVHTCLKKREEGFDFLIMSQLDLQSNQWTEHATGKIAFVGVQPPKQYDLQAIEADLELEEVISLDLNRQPPEGSLQFGDRWNNCKKAILGQNHGLAALELPDVFTEDFNSYRLHPALLDRATGFPIIKFQDENAYLPFHYKRLSIKGPLPSKIYSYLRTVENQFLPADILKFNITIMDAQGTELVEIEEFSLRRVSLEKSTTTTIQRTDTQSQELSPVLENDNFCLTISSPGALDTLKFRPEIRKEPGPGEVEIEVGAAGLNFKEVLFALGLMPIPSDLNFKFGLECAGKIVALGEGVENFKVGDAVMAFGSSCFSQFITTSSQLVVPKPESLSLQEAATIPIAFTTAYYSLLKLGRLCQGEKVLIHAAAGGVGMAAVQIAKWKRAQIFATAGSSEKREYLQSLGIKYVMDSRSTAFADEVMQYTEGRGVDVVLNSLGGEFIPKGLSVLTHYGRFLELGQRDILSNSQIGLGAFEKSLSFFAIQVNSGLPEFNSLWREIVGQFQKGHLGPLPYKVFSMTEVSDAFNHIARAKHIGKVVISLEEQEIIKSRISEEDAMGRKVQGIPSSSTTPFHRFPVSLVDSSKLEKSGRPAKKTKQQLELLENGLSPSEGIEAFSRILASAFPQVLVSNNGLVAEVNGKNSSQLLTSSETFEQPNLNVSTHSIEPSHPRPELSNDYIAPRNEIEQKVAYIWQNLLGIEKVGVHDNFFELGGDSILAVQVRSKLQEAFDRDFSTTDLFQYPTLNELTNYISQEQVEKPDFQRAHDRAEKQQGAMEEELQLIEQRRKRRG